MKERLEAYYADYDEEGRLVKLRRGQVEYITTMRYIHKYLHPGAKILEIGAGTGRYSVTLAREGYDVTAVELVEHNLSILRSKITPDMNIQAMQGNALDLSALASEGYDMTLLLGPMYHLFDEADKKQALSEALRVTKPGGVLMTAYCIAEGSIIEYGLKRNHMSELIASGMLDSETFETFSKPQDLFELVRKSDIDALMDDFDTERLHYVATDGFSYFMRPEIAEMDEDTFRLFLKYHLAICENPDLVGATAHSLDVRRKGASPCTLGQTCDTMKQSCGQGRKSLPTSKENP